MRLEKTVRLMSDYENNATCEAELQHDHPLKALKSS